MVVLFANIAGGERTVFCNCLKQTLTVFGKGVLMELISAAFHDKVI